MQKRICIVYTGGTIGMLPSSNGFAPQPGCFAESLAQIPDLHSPEMPQWELVELSPLLDSSNIAADQWYTIGQAIYQRYHLFDGFVVLHGTDTMAYTASALSFMLENLNKPVIFTGSQIPLCQIRSDGRDNLLTSLLIAAQGKVNQVCLYFGGVLLRGNRATKCSADGLQAFSSPNYPVLATAGVDIRYNPAAIGPQVTAGPLELVQPHTVPIGVLKVFPGIQFELFESILTNKLRAIVLETFGTGNLPDYNGSLLPLMQKAFAQGTLVTVCSQCHQGAVHLGTYATSSPLKQAGAVSGLDMTTEAAVAKLYYLFSKGFEPDAIKYWMEQDLRGELTPMV